DSDIAKQICQDAKLTPGTIDDTKLKFEYVLQNNMTNLEFLRLRAEIYNYEVVVEDGEKFHFRKPAIKKQAELKLKRGRDLKHFRARMNLSRKVAKVLVRGWDWKNAKPQEITATADKADIQDDMGLQKLGPEILQNFASQAQLKPQQPPPDADGVVEVV